MTPAEIIAAVSEACRVPVPVIMGRNRTPRVCEARFMAVWIMREGLFMGYEALGAEFKRDHTAIIHAFKRAEHLRETHRPFLTISNRLLTLTQTKV